MAASSSTRPVSTTPRFQQPVLLPHRAIQSGVTSFNAELLLLSRLIYKNTAQHRSELFWRRVKEVQRLGRRIQAAIQSGEVPFTLNHSSEKKNTVYVDGNEKESVGTWNQHVKMSLLQDKFTSSVEKLQISLQQLIDLTHFLPLAVTLLALVSRLWIITSSLERHLHSLMEVRFEEKAKIYLKKKQKTVPN